MHSFTSMSACACLLSFALCGAASAAGANIEHCNQPMGTIALDAVPAGSVAELRRVIDQSNCFVVVDPRLEIHAPANRKARSAGLDYRTRRLGRFEWILPDYTARVVPATMEQGSVPALAVIDSQSVRIAIAAAPAMLQDAIAQR